MGVILATWEMVPFSRKHDRGDGLELNRSTIRDPDFHNIRALKVEGVYCVWKCSGLLIHLAAGPGGSESVFFFSQEYCRSNVCDVLTSDGGRIRAVQIPVNIDGVHFEDVDEYSIPQFRRESKKR